jgi:tetratricopeptide (TPR) repeat protein
MREMRAIVCIFALLACSSAQAEDLQAARQHFDRGQTLYDLQRYVESAREYELAYEAKPDPAFLYDIAQAYRFGGDAAKALGAYRAFRRHSPDAAAKMGVDARIAEMEKLVISGKPAPKPTEPPPPEQRPIPPAPAPVAPTVETKTPAPAPTVLVAAPPPRTGRAKVIAGSVVGGLGVALLGAGVALTIVGQSAYDTLQNPSPGYQFDPSTQDAMRADYPAGLTLIGVGAAAVITGAAVLVVGVRERRR